MKACRQNFLNAIRLREWSDVHRQLADLARSAKLPRGSHSGDSYDPIHRALLAGLLGKAMYRPDDGPEYTAAGGVKCVLWPGSGIFRKKPKWAMAAELVETGRRYARTAARISPQWIEPLAGHVVRYEWSEPRWNPDAGSAQCDEKVTLYGLPVVPRRAAGLAKYDALLARTLFIQHGLLEYDLPGVDPVDGSGGPEFLYFNRQLQVEAEKLQAKARGADLLVGPQARFEFYDERLPNVVTDLPRLNRWLKEASEEERAALVMERSDFLKTGAAVPDATQYPDALNLAGAEAQIEYRLRPGDARSGDDGGEEAAEGLTVHVDRRDAHRLSAARLGWLVPGLLAEKVTALIRGLPKDLRTRFVPVPDTAKEVVDLLTFGEGDLLVELSRVLQRIGGERVPVELLEAVELPRHLRMTVRVAGGDGGPATVAVPADGRSEKAVLAPARPPEERFHRDGLTQWDFGELPEAVTVGGAVNGKTLHPGAGGRGGDGLGPAVRLGGEGDPLHPRRAAAVAGSGRPRRVRRGAGGRGRHRGRTAAAGRGPGAGSRGRPARLRAAPQRRRLGEDAVRRGGPPARRVTAGERTGRGARAGARGGESFARRPAPAGVGGGPCWTFSPRSKPSPRRGSSSRPIGRG